MKPLMGIGSACALWLLAIATPAQAAWNNVFQVCCASCGKAPVAAAPAPATSYYAAAPQTTCCAPPQPVCTTRYVQRCYYQPVTCYQTKTYYQQVTTYRTSYYYEPVTSYRYSCYYDPCSCSYKQQACPVTTYRLRSQCCPVNNWVQRCCQVPVTTYRVSSYWEPVTTCCQPPAPPCCPTAAPQAPCCQTGYQAPAQAVAPAPQQPAVTEQRPQQPPQAPAVQELPGSQGYNNPQPAPQYDRYYPPNNSQPQQNRLPPSSGSSLQRPVAPAPPSVRLDKIVSLPHSGVNGQVINGGNARLMFVSLDPQVARQQVQAGNDGRFQVQLASGGWLVYIQGNDNRPVFHSKIDVRANETSQITLVSR